MDTAKTPSTLSLYDTTLRDGAQRRGISLSIEDKIKITALLDDFGIQYIEGGWPGSNPKDCEFFKRIKELELKQAKIAAFGSTRRASLAVEEDPNLKALSEAETPVVTIVGKGSGFHVKEVLRTSYESNLCMIKESVSFMKSQAKEVIFDSEHFFDGYVEDPAYAIDILKAAVDGGADSVVLCDTNGGKLPDFIEKAVIAVRNQISVPVGIHAHNDSDVAVANSLAAVRAGCVQVQGTINGYGERCGNANLISIIPILQLKMGIPCVPDESLAGLTQLSRKISGIANMNADNHAPFVGASSFAHKGGIHVSAIEKTPLSYEHIEPIRVGNQRKVVISELSGAGNIRARASELGFSIKGDEAPLLNRIKNLEAKGFQFENAEGSFELMLHKLDADYQAPFEIIDIMEVSEQRSDRNMAAKAMCKIRVAENVFHTAADGDGPVHAIDNAMRKALIPAFPEIADVRLADYKVRILDPENTTGATTRVTIQARANGDIWTTVGCSSNIIEASWHALCDSYELFIIRRRSL